MKKLFSIAIIAMSATLFFTSCKKSTTVAAGKCSISCDASGSYTKSYSSNAIASTVNKGLVIQMLATNASITDAVTWTIVLPVDVTTGTYNMKDQGNTATAFGFAAISESIGYGADEAGGFTYSITQADATGIEGTFAGKMLEDGTTGKVVNVTNGKFKAVY
jgi:hypothetical protein